MWERYDYCILGGGVAGGMAIEAIRARDPQGSIALLAAEPVRPYHRPPLSKEVLLGAMTAEQTYLRPPTYYERERVVLRTGTRVVRLDANGQTLELADGTRVAFGRLLFAPGSRARRLDLPGADLEGVFTLRTMDDSLAIREALTGAKAAVIIGGSFIGAEVASASAQQGVETVLVFPEAHLFARLFDEETGRAMDAMFVREGVRILPGRRPQRFVGERRVRGVMLDDGQEYPCDMAVMGVGVQLNVELAREAGLEMSPDGGVLVDHTLHTSNPRIWAAGDVASYDDVALGVGHLRVEHWDTALNHGLVAGANMAGAGQTFDHLPYFFSLLFGASPQVYGDLRGWEQVVGRGDLARGRYLRAYFRGGVFRAFLSLRRTRDEVEVAQRWLRERRRYEEIAPLLADESVPLGQAEMA